MDRSSIHGRAETLPRRPFLCAVGESESGSRQFVFELGETWCLGDYRLGCFLTRLPTIGRQGRNERIKVFTLDANATGQTNVLEMNACLVRKDRTTVAPSNGC